MSLADLERWQTAAMALSEEAEVANIRMPIHIFLTEAEGYETFVGEHWEPSGDRPGLKVVAKRFPLEAVEDSRSLLRAARYAHSLVLREDERPSLKPLLDRANLVLDELGAVLEFVLDDGVDEPADHTLAAVKARVAEDSTQATTIQALKDYSMLGRELEDRLVDEVADFDPSLIEEADQLANEIGGFSDEKEKSKRAIALRNRLLSLAAKRVQEIRRAVRYVFRNHPDLMRQTSSAYGRRMRLARRRRAAAEEQVD